MAYFPSPLPAAKRLRSTRRSSRRATLRFAPGCTRLSLGVGPYETTSERLAHSLAVWARYGWLHLSSGNLFAGAFLARRIAVVGHRLHCAGFRWSPSATVATVSVHNIHHPCATVGFKMLGRGRWRSASSVIRYRSTQLSVARSNKALHPTYLPPLRCGKYAGELGR